MTLEVSKTPRVLRHVKEHRKLLSKAEQIALIHPAVSRCAIDHSVGASQSKAGFEPHDLANMQVWTSTGSFTVILLPLRLYYRPMWRRRALELKRYLRNLGKRCLVAPASYLDRQPRLQNARLLAGCRRTHVSATDRILLMAKISDAVCLSLQDAANCIQAKDPAAVVLNLVAERALYVDPNKVIGPHSMVAMRWPS